jgi:hypothetical protein
LNAPTHHYHQTLSLSVTTTAFHIIHCRHQTLPAATAIKCHLCRRRPLLSCLHLSLPPPSPLSITTLKISARHCHPLPQPSNAIFAAAALCHLSLPCPLNASNATTPFEHFRSQQTVAAAAGG